MLIFTQKIKNKKFSVLLRSFFNKIFKTNLNKFHYLVLNINKNHLYPNKYNLKIKELSYNDFLLGDKSIFDEQKLSLIKKRFSDSSYICYGIIEDNILIYSTWISFEKLGLPIKTNIKLNENEALLEDSYCHPNYRGRGLHSKMNSFRISKIAESGKIRVIAIVLDKNIPALKVQEKTGFYNLGFFYAGKILGIPFTTLKKEKYDNK